MSYHREQFPAVQTDCDEGPDLYRVGFLQ
jgi:hypothetical protein